MSHILTIVLGVIALGGCGPVAGCGRPLGNPGDPSDPAPDPRPPAPIGEQEPDPALPGVPKADVSLVEKLDASWKAKGPAYKPRTHHLNTDGSPKFINRLILETSPYLLQHTHNPVNWYPWGNEAFERAMRENKPVLMSVGHSTCHWCHVMERESFEDEEIARLLNENYIAIKVGSRGTA